MKDLKTTTATAIIERFKEMQDYYGEGYTYFDITYKLKEEVGHVVNLYLANAIHGGEDE